MDAHTLPTDRSLIIYMLDLITFGKIKLGGIEAVLVWK